MLRPALLTLAASTLAIGAIAPASALSMKDCSTKYQAAKQAGTLGAQKWNDFRKAECGDSASAAPASTTAAPAPAPTKTAAPAPAPAPAPVPTTTAARPAPAPAPTTTVARPAPSPAAPTGTAAFPSAVNPKYSTEAAGKARMHTCLDQYNANKAAGGNGGLNWIMKGGGYYAECNKRLKS